MFKRLLLILLLVFSLPNTQSAFGGACDPGTNGLSTVALDTDSDGWSGYTSRQLINSAQLSGNAVSVKVTLKAGTTQNAKLNRVYIGHAAASGDPYDFDGNQVEALFSGASGVDIAAGTTATSDCVTFNLDSTKNLIVAVDWVTDTNKDMSYYKSGITGFTSYYLAASAEANLTNASSGYSSGIEIDYGVVSVLGELAGRRRIVIFD